MPAVNGSRLCLIDTYQSLLMRLKKMCPILHRETYTSTALTKSLLCQPSATIPAASPQPVQPSSLQPRFVNLTQHVFDRKTQDILERGPNFALTQKVSPSILTRVEVGIERLFYAMKWATHISDRKANRTTSESDSSDTAPVVEDTNVTQDIPSFPASLPRPMFRDSDVQQPPD